jgi:hypothetical protein
MKIELKRETQKFNRRKCFRSKVVKIQILAHASREKRLPQNTFFNMMRVALLCVCRHFDEVTSTDRKQIEIAS